MSGGFVKIYGTILDSTLWDEPATTVKVWITMLAMADQNGIVRMSLPGLARRAVVSLADCQKAIATFEAPDEHSQDKKRDPTSDGKRIEDIPSGWRIINHAFYRDLRTDKQVEDAERQRKHREAASDPCDSHKCHSPSQVVATDEEEDAEEDANAVKKPSSTAREAVPEKTPLAGILSALAIPPEKRTSWTALLEGMAQGIGTPGMRPVSWEVLAEAATELSTATGTYSAHRYKTYVSKALERRAREAEPKTRTRYGPEDPPPRKRTPYRPDDGKPRNPEKLGDLMGEFKKLRASDEKPRRDS